VTDQRYLIRHQRTLKTIENRVLEEVWIGRVWRVVGGALATALAGTALACWLEAMGQESPHAANRVPTVTVVGLVVASAVSARALRLRRYRWCCAAAYCCGLAAVIGIGAFWWVRTGHAGIGLSWLVLADLAEVPLTLGWLAVIVTPIERNQPDMRRRFVRPGK
jgi:hypothetical protein